MLNDVLAQTPEMPEAYNPSYEAWKELFERFPLNEETMLIGHSCGAGFIIRYLSENSVRVGKVVLVAPWLDLEHFLDTGMFDFEVNPDIVSRTQGITIFSSSDDMAEVQDSIALLKERVEDIKIVEFGGMGHFCYEDMHTDVFPELLRECLE